MLQTMKPNPDVRCACTHTGSLPFRRPPNEERVAEPHPTAMQVTLADAGRFVNQDPIGLIGGVSESVCVSA